MLNPYVCRSDIFDDCLTELLSTVDTSLVFWAPEVKVDEPAAFQLSLSAAPGTIISALPFSSLAVHFDEKIPPVTVVHRAADDDTAVQLIQRVDLGQTRAGADIAEDAAREVEANLRWRPGAMIIVTGSLVSAAPATLTVCQPSVWK